MFLMTELSSLPREFFYQENNRKKHGLTGFGELFSIVDQHFLVLLMLNSFSILWKILISTLVLTSSASSCAD